MWVALSEALFWANVVILGGREVSGALSWVVWGGWDWVGVGALFDNAPMQLFLWVCKTFEIYEIFRDIFL